MKKSSIRNFSIIAHIDHGKTTLSDRVLERTGALTTREMKDQVLDDMELERERGITIKARTVTLPYRTRDGREHVLNLIDTPGHVDFSYEVSRSLAACEGAVLLVDATQGVQAQTLSHGLLAIDNGLVLVPVINKVDAASAEPERAMEQIEEAFAIPREECLLVSAKEGGGVEELLEAVVERVPPPGGDASDSPRARVFDSWYNPYRGVVALVRVVDGCLEERQAIRFMATRGEFEVEEVGVFSPKPVRRSALGPGEVGYVIAGVKDVHEAQVGDTITDARRPAEQPLPGFREVKPMVFAGLYPTQAEEYGAVREALEKLNLNDSALSYEPETSKALGYGFRCGFLGLLHMEIVQERLEREYDLQLITTAPTVKYEAHRKDGTVVELETPQQLPSPLELDHIEEPYIEATVISREDSVGAVLQLLEDRRGEQKKFEYLSPGTVLLVYEMPLSEMVMDLHDKLKTVSRGYASLDYHLIGTRPSELVRLDILVNGQLVDALSLIIPKERAFRRGKALVEKMRTLIPRQMFEVALQAAIGSRVLARETVPALRKNVLAKCYGGDVTRKRKLLEKQREGKRRMKRIGRVDIPQEAFLAIIKA